MKGFFLYTVYQYKILIPKKEDILLLQKFLSCVCVCLGEHFSWERKSTEEFKILDSDDVMIWCFCGKKKIYKVFT